MAPPCGALSSGVRRHRMRAFNPWVGDRYWTTGLNGLRLLILGESQYDAHSDGVEEWTGAPTPECKFSTQAIVQELAIDKRNRFFTKVAKLVLNKPAGAWLSDEDRRSFWQQVAFYNYIQWWLRGPRYRPSRDMWTDARSALLEVLNELSPSVMLILGNELLSQLPPLPNNIVQIHIPHPSSRGFSYDPWCEQISATVSAIQQGGHHG